MPMRAPKGRVRVGEQAAPGDVRPVTNRTLILIGLAIVVAVTVAITALIFASGSPKSVPRNTKNVPHSLESSTPPVATPS